MMRTVGLLCCFLLLLPLYAQKTISGKVLTTEDVPLEGATVYLNNTSIGTTTNEQGEFELLLKEGTYDLIASYLGFETAQFSLNTQTINQSIVFKLNPKTNMLNEVVVSNRKKKFSAEDRAYFLSQFKRTFLGKTDLSKECKILNEEAIDFDYNPLSRTLEAYAAKPIVLEHKGLGYTIYYDLIHFELSPEKVTYLGYTRYENLKGSSRKKKKWHQKRQIAYHGSSMHFFKSLLNETLRSEGFIVDHFKRIPNPDRPSDSVIQLARKKLADLYRADANRTFKIVSNKDLNNKDIRQEALERASQNEKVRTTIDLKNLKDSHFVVSEKNGTFVAQTQTAINKEKDSLNTIVEKARLKRWIDVDLKKDIASSEFVIKDNNTYALYFPHYLKIKYINEAEEDNYRPGTAKLNYQVSMITLMSSSAPIDVIGTLVNPLDIFLEGYWAYEKIADQLPLDFEPD